MSPFSLAKEAWLLAFIYLSLAGWFGLASYWTIIGILGTVWMLFATWNNRPKSIYWVLGLSAVIPGLLGAMGYMSEVGDERVQSFRAGPLVEEYISRSKDYDEVLQACPIIVERNMIIAAGHSAFAVYANNPVAAHVIAPFLPSQEEAEANCVDALRKLKQSDPDLFTIMVYEWPHMPAAAQD